MALIRCNECGREISDKAASCPGCGAPVEAVAKSPAPQPSDQSPANPTDQLWEQVHEAIYAGRKIEAIKLYREIMGAGYGLADAKAAVERLTADLQAKQPEKFTKAARNTNKQGCVAMLLAAAIFGVLFYNYFLNSDSPASKPSDPGKDAYYAARVFVSQNLKAPRDADFSTPGTDNGTGWRPSGPDRWAPAHVS